MIRVVIVDDHALVRQGLAHILAAAPDVALVGEATNGLEAATVCAAVAPDVVLMDVSMPGVDGIEATRRVVALAHAPFVVMLTAFADRVKVLGALEAGAHGYLMKDADPSAILEAIRAAARGETPLSPRVAGTVVSAVDSHDAPRLSDRERAVLRLLAGGLSNKAIAAELGIAEKTVKGHLTRVFRELDVTDRTSAALRAGSLGLGSP